MPELLWRPDPDHRLSILFDVYALSQHVRTLVTTALAGSGLRPDEYAAYSVVFEAGSLTMTELARSLGLALTTTADVVRTMRGRGHLRKAPHPTDSRSYLLTLTPAGLRSHRKASTAFDRAYQALIEALPPNSEAPTRAVLQQLTTGAATATHHLSHPAHRPADPPPPNRPAAPPVRGAAKIAMRGTNLQ
jgi:DNA-binding MarR family transcriptional regulator